MSELNKFPSNFVSEQFVEYIDRKEIGSLTESLAHTIDQKYEGQELVVIGMLKGSMLFMSELLKHIRNVNIYVDFASLSAVGRTKENAGTITITKDITTDIHGKNVLIVEQIIDTGRAVQFFKKHLKLNQPKNIEIVTLFDKPYKRAVPVQVDYIGKQIQDQFIVGHGLDLDQYGRNIEDIFYLQYPN